LRNTIVQQPWIKFPHGDAAVQIFCFPYSGGSAQLFQAFARMMPPGIGVYALEMPGRGRRFKDTPHDTLRDQVREAVAGLATIRKGTESLFFGHSIGGLIAFETARELRREGQSLPRHIFVSAIRAPQIPRREQKVHNLTDEEFIGKLKEMGGTPQEILAHQEMLELMLPILRNDFKLYETYAYKAEKPLTCPITAFAGTLDEDVTRADIDAWALHTSSIFTSHMFKGGHFFIHDHFPIVADIILKILSRHWSL
jgi:medium-chain acyl-[acyl-carrier-protein] hydrolase